jgi:hypothetical protein
MKASRTSETSVDIDLTTRQYIPEDSELQLLMRLLLLETKNTNMSSGWKLN